MPFPSTPASANLLSAPQKALIKLGLKSDIDLPLRYEGETRIVMLRDAPEVRYRAYRGDGDGLTDHHAPAPAVAGEEVSNSRCEWRIRAAAYRSPAKSKRSSKC